MFHRERDASKVALVGLVELLKAARAQDQARDGRHGARRLLDVQWATDHLVSLGAVGGQPAPTTSTGSGRLCRCRRRPSAEHMRRVRGSQKDTPEVSDLASAGRGVWSRVLLARTANGMTCPAGRDLIT